MPSTTKSISEYKHDYVSFKMYINGMSSPFGFTVQYCASAACIKTSTKENVSGNRQEWERASPSVGEGLAVIRLFKSERKRQPDYWEKEAVHVSEKHTF